MKNLFFALTLVLVTARVGQAQIYEFKAYHLANYGSPFTYVPTTREDLESAISGRSFNHSHGTNTLAELLQGGVPPHSQEYDVGGGLHVKFSAEAIHHPAEPLSTAAPGIGAKSFASNNQYPGAATVIGETLVYLKDTVSVRNFTGRDHVLESFNVNFELDGFADVSGDAVVQVGMAYRMTSDGNTLYGTPLVYTGAEMKTLQEALGGLITTYNFGQPLPFSEPPITLTGIGPYGAQIIDQGTHHVTVETLLYVRAQTGGLRRGAGTANANFSNTMRVANIQFFDENDQVIPGLQVVGSSGDVYPYNAVPEPSMLAIFGAGSIGLLFARFRRSQRS